jgi:hypothetical protein
MHRSPILIAILVALAFSAAGSAAGSSVPRNTAPPAIRGAAQEGSVLTADPGGWRSDSAVAYSYQWRRCAGAVCADIGGANDRIYAVGTGDIAHAIQVVVFATNKEGTAPAASAPTAAVTPLPAQAPHDAAAPAIAGTAKAGQVLTASPGTWAPPAGLRFAYMWRICRPNGGDCRETRVRSQSYRLGGREVNRSLRVLVTAVNAAGSSAALSAATAAVQPAGNPPARPANTAAPHISGTAQVGKTLSGSAGVWANGPRSYSYAWLRCNRNGNGCAGIGGARSANYTVAPGDAGSTIRFQVTASNRAGSAVAFSSATAVVAPAAPTASTPANTSRPRISGTAQEGKTLTGDRGAWSGNPTSYDTVWLRCDADGHNCNPIGGSSANTYPLGGADVGHRLRFEVTARNSAGAESATSEPTAAVRASAAPSASSAPTIAGTPQEGATLTAAPGVWNHQPTAFAYEWWRCDRNGGSCAAILGAHGTAYRLGSADVGNTLRLHVTATNSAGNSSATSIPTAVIQKAAAPPPSRPSGCPPGGNPDQVANIQGPATLIIDAWSPTPSVITRGTTTWTFRVHVTSTCGGPVQGALVYGTATPFNQWTVPAEQPTGPDGWATLTFQRLTGFPTSPRQQVIAMFLRARKPGANVLAGITGYRLVSVRVNLH